MATQLDDQYEVPLRDQRYFGAGIKRKRIQFVPSASNEANVQSLPATPSQSAADRYLSIVLRKSASAERHESAPPVEYNDHVEIEGGNRNKKVDLDQNHHQDPTCDVCHRPIILADETRPHQSSIAHQICLQHSHPPSHIDRKRKGLAVLENQGWDLDSRKGLGFEGKGILHPIKAKENPSKAGLGMRPEDLKVMVMEKPTKLDAGKVRLLETANTKKAERLRNDFYRSDDMEKYLGGDGDVNLSLDMPAFKRAKRRYG